MRQSRTNSCRTGCRHPREPCRSQGSRRRAGGLQPDPSAQTPGGADISVQGKWRPGEGGIDAAASSQPVLGQPRRALEPANHLFDSPSTVIAWGPAIAASSKKQQAGWYAIKWLTSKTNMLGTSIATTLPSPRKSVYALPARLGHIEASPRSSRPTPYSSLSNRRNRATDCTLAAPYRLAHLVHR